MPGLALLLALSGTADAAQIAATDRNWMLSAAGGVMSRDDDKAHGFGSGSITRKLGKAYVKATVSRFDYGVQQVDVRLPSTYTLAYLSGGATFGHWFVDGYAMGGIQHYRPIETDLGKKHIMGSDHSGVYGVGADGGYIKWFGNRWSLTPSIAISYVHSRALREQIGPKGPSEYETTEAGVTGAATLRLDRRFGRNGKHDLDLYVSRYQTSNQSAALSSGTRGALFPAEQSGRRQDGWMEFGAGASLQVSPSLYLDAGALRTVGAQGGDVTTGSSGFRLLF